MPSRSAARKKWALISQGNTDRDLLAWLQGVAKKILQADLSSPSKRPFAIMRAVELQGTLDRYEKIRELIEVLDTFENLDRPDKRGESMRRKIAHVRNSGLVGDDKADHEIRKLIDQAMRSSKKV